MSDIETVDVSVKIPKAEKDLADAIVIAYKDFKASKSSSIIGDEMPSIIKLFGEISELLAEFKSKSSILAAEYLANQLLGI